MRLLLLVLVVLAVGVWVGIWIGFMLGFSRAARETADHVHSCRRRGAAWAFIICGTGFLALAMVFALNSWHFITKAEQTTGTVVELVEQLDDAIALFGQVDTKDAITYAPTFSFHDSLGKEHTVTASVSSNPPDYRVGDRVPVVYLGNSPKNAQIESCLDLWSFPTSSGGIGFLSLAIGLLVLFWPLIFTKSKQAT